MRLGVQRNRSTAQVMGCEKPGHCDRALDVVGISPQHRITVTIPERIDGEYSIGFGRDRKTSGIQSKGVAQANYRERLIQSRPVGIDDSAVEQFRAAVPRLAEAPDR